MLSYFFLFKQKTAYVLRISDWSSHVCSSDLNAEKRASFAPLKKKINEIESLTAKLEKLIQGLDKELADPALYEKAPAKASAKAKERGEAAAKLSAAEEEWLRSTARRVGKECVSTVRSRWPRDHEKKKKKVTKKKKQE